MIKKLGNTGLLLILLALLGVFALFRYISGKHGENTFQTSIIPTLDTNKINGMVIFPRATAGKPYIFTKKGTIWFASQGDVTSRAEPHAARYLISQMQQIRPDRLGSNDPKDWKQFCVNDSLGTRVALLEDKDTVLNVIVGRFSYIPSQRQGMSYVRLAGHNEVYDVEGFLSMNITQDFDAWRDRKIMPADYDQWTKLTYTYPGDSGFVIYKLPAGSWAFDKGNKPDSAAAINIIKDVSNQNYGTFINHFDTAGKRPVFTLLIEGNGFNPVTVRAFPADSLNQYAITSSLNPGLFFSGYKASLCHKIFPVKASFFQKDFDDPNVAHFAKDEPVVKKTKTKARH